MTNFENDISNEHDLVKELRNGSFKAVRLDK